MSGRPIPSKQPLERAWNRTLDRTVYNTHIDTPDTHTMAHITANDLKTRGIAAIEASLGGGRTEALVSVRGADRYVVMELAHYQHLRECELEAALAESRADIAAGRFVVESPARHVARAQALIASETTPEAGPAPARKATARKRSGGAPAKAAKTAKPAAR